MGDSSEKPKERPIIHGGYSGVWRRAIKGDLDGRSIMARATKELKEALVRDLGGADNITTQKGILIDRIITKTFRCQAIETLMLEGEELTQGTENLYLSLSSSLRKDLTVLGLGRTPQNITEGNKMDLKKLSIEELKVLETLIRKMESGIELTLEEEIQLEVLGKQYPRKIEEEDPE